MELKSNVSYLIAVLLIASIPNTANCQLLDWLVDYAVDEVVGNTVSSWWNSYLDSEAKDAVKRRVSRLAEWPLDQDAINGPDTKYNMKRTANPYSSNYSVLSERTKSYFNSVQYVNFSSLADGEFGKSTTSFMDSIQSVTIFSYLESVVSKTVMDSVNTYNVNRQMLLNDIKADKRLALLLNNHPELVRIYNNTKDTKLKSDCISLLYWGVLANEQAKYFPPKTSFINGRNVTFSNLGNEVALRYNDNNIATIKGRDITCKDVNLMNLRPMPNMIYSYNGIKYYTDNLGRVIKVEQFIGSNTKGKNTQKSILAGKKFNVIKNGYGQEGMLYSLALLKHQAPDCGMNTVFIQKNSSNKKELKRLKKSIKTVEKSNLSKLMITEVVYDSGLDHASGILITIGSETFSFDDFSNRSNSTFNNKSKEMQFLKELKSQKISSKEFSGNIAGKYNVKAKLVFDNDIISGTYYYLSQGSDKILILKGNRIGNSITMQEYTVEGQKCGSFSGTMSGDKISGTFYNAKGQSMSFVLTED